MLKKLSAGFIALSLLVLAVMAPSTARAETVQVYILMGQSNMVGFGGVSGGTDGKLDYAVNTKNLYPYLSNGSGGWSSRNDVRQAHVQGSGDGGSSLMVNDWLTADNRNNIGPEQGIGHALGNAIDAPVMLLKSCTGNRSLGWDLLPPGSTQ